MQVFLVSVGSVLTLLLIVWIAAGFGISRENEGVVKIRLGRPYGMVPSGWYWIAYGIDTVRKYTTKVVELQIAQRDGNWNVVRDERQKPIPAGGFITKAGDGFGPLNIGVSISFRFNWPTDNWDLMQKCVKLLPNPGDEPALTNLFQEVIMDETRSVGCNMTYMKIMSDRKEFARLISESVRLGGSSQLLIDTGLDRSAHVVIDHIDVPKETLDAIDKEEAERLVAQGVRRKAEGERDKLKLEGEGRAAAIKAIKAEGEEAMELEGQRTLREMATGTSNTIFFPLEGVANLMKNFLKGTK